LLRPVAPFDEIRLVKRASAAYLLGARHR